MASPLHQSASVTVELLRIWWSNVKCQSQHFISKKSASLGHTNFCHYSMPLLRKRTCDQIYNFGSPLGVMITLIRNKKNVVCVNSFSFLFVCFRMVMVTDSLCISLHYCLECNSFAKTETKHTINKVKETFNLIYIMTIL